MKKTIRDFDLYGKKVIIRVDFNVPIKDGVITDDNRIRMSLSTIQYALDNGAKIILLSHLGRIKTEADKVTNSLEPVAFHLSELLNHEVIFVNETHGKLLEQEINNLEIGDILLVENTRFEDLDNKKESNNDPALGAYWASLGDIFINDAFGTAHRAHASNVGIATHLPSGIGFLMEKELTYLNKAITHPERPLTVILGGSKVSDKIKVIENLVKIADYILIGGGMMYTFLYAKGYKIGKSLLDHDSIDFCKRLLDKYSSKIVLPIDLVGGLDIKEDTFVKHFNIDEMEDGYMGLDIGENTISLFESYLNRSHTVIWNGPVGVFEIPIFAKGTHKLCEILSGIDAKVIIGGGDTAAAVIKMGYKDSFAHISTGGGASLELLEGKLLPAIDVVEEKC